MSQQTDSNALAPNSQLLEHYTIIKVLGEGGFGITYLVKNSIGKQFAIKEYLPQDQAIRQHQSQQIKARTNRADDFNYGLKQFLNEAKNLVPFSKHPNIVTVIHFSESNGTAYLIMDYEEGQTLSERLKKHPPLSEAEIIRIMLDISEGLAEIHQHKMLHRDIKPSNIYLCQNGTALLIDFGSSRYALGEKSKSLSAIIAEGYAPPEQYSRHGKQDTYTDLYALGATLYKMLTGQIPIESIARRDALFNGEADPYQPAINISKTEYATWLKQLADQLLVLPIKTRPANTQQVLNALHRQQALKEDEKTKIVNEQERWQKTSKTRIVEEEERWQEPVKPKGKGLKIAVALMILLTGIGAGYWFYLKPLINDVKITDEQPLIDDTEMTDTRQSLMEQQKKQEARQYQQAEQINDYIAYLNECQYCEDKKNAQRALKVLKDKQSQAQIAQAEKERQLQMHLAEEAQKKERLLAEQRRKQGKKIGQYQVYNNGTVKDTKTGLLWKHCAEGLSGADCSIGEARAYTFDYAVKQFKNVRYAGMSRWRLPTIKELKTLVYCSNGISQKTAWDKTCSGSGWSDNAFKKNSYQRPTINQVVFPNTSPGASKDNWHPYIYWSSLPNVYPPNLAWIFSFKYGLASATKRKNEYSVRLVRAGQ